MFKRIIVCGSVLAGLLSMSACCNMRNGPTQFVKITSKPEGVTVRIQPGGDTIVTPGEVVLKRYRSHVVTFEKSGYQTTQVRLVSEGLADVWWRNIIWIHPIFWGIGVIVDKTTGSGYKLTPVTADVTLTRLSEGGAPRDLGPPVKPPS